MVNSNYRIKLLREAALKRAEEQTTQRELVRETLNATTQVIENKIAEQNNTAPTKESLAILRGLEDTVNHFDWDDKQKEAIELAKAGKSMILIGAAGTGKTTTVKAMIQALIQSGKIGTLKEGSKALEKGSPAVAFVSFTNRAVRNLIKSLPDHLKNNCKTIHKLLEYEPQPVEIEDPDSGETRISKQFLPQRTKDNPIEGIEYIVVDEASMVSTYLFAQLNDACPGAKYIFIGDLNQLAPVIGDAILGYKLLELPVVELTTVHRTAQDSKITMFAHAIKNGNAMTEKTLKPWEKEGELEFHPYKRDVTHNEASQALKKFFEKEVEEGRFNADTDIILCPYNKERHKEAGEYVSTRNINKAIANKYSEINNAEVWEIIAGWEKHYYAVGDKIMFNKLEGKIIKIYPNKSYVGTPTLMPSKNLDRWGRPKDGNKVYVSADFEDEFNMVGDEADWDGINLAGRVDETDEDAKRKNDCSHKIVVSLETGETKTIGSSADVNNKLTLGYCLSIHQSQGSEWRKVYLVLHSSHFIVSREMLYTGVTRAREHLYCIYSKESTPRGTNGNFFKGVKRQEVKGKTLADKAEYFRSKMGKLTSNSALRDTINIPQEEDLGMMDFK